MKWLWIVMAPALMWAKVHYAKVEPYDTVTLKAAVSAQVIDTQVSLEGIKVDGKAVIRLDDKLDQKNLESSRASLQLLKNMLEINRELQTSLQSSAERQEAYYKRLSRLKTASQTQKDNAFSAYTGAKTQALGTKEKVMSLEKQILDMEYKIAMLEDSIGKKSIVLHGEYLYKLMVRKGDFVGPGSPLAVVKETDRAKLTLFLDKQEVENLSQTRVYIDGNLTDYKVDKVWEVADEKYISSYRAEITIPSPTEQFSTLLKVELK